ncbi:NapC/NirT cytochrome c domain protein [Vibrio ichthyoenteri ATCC 700023]|uniref:Cytochrome c-type protein n=1 Tax=Vibrio ichthyoenteri ATCC 700023 TaxID=870968 RepID=F9S703_9VIBR|nr:NapC/NirT family cytochrome c [Vibrio ichthyoenteri]EGU32069.1 NapC/NirT cytochrome c domain protein [Vibrio ichthyoenteri ATCC 700023]
MKFFQGVKRKVIIALLVIGGGLGLLASLPATEALHALSSNEFCGSCHTMKPMVETFANSVHGGNNSHGFVAECTDCHLPKSNVVEELYVKGTSGMRHLWGEYILGMEALDYQSLHPKRTEYVFDSGCVNCHKDLERRALLATEESEPADWTHNLAFARKDNDPQWKCSSCHYDIAHPQLEENMAKRAEDKLRMNAKEAFKNE